MKAVLQNDAKIVIYGAGVIGQVTAPQFVQDLQLSDRVLLIADQDKNKQGKSISIGGHDTAVVPPYAMKGIEEPFVILVTGSRYERILAYLDKAGIPENTDVYILPGILVKSMGSPQKQRVIKISETPLIPKKIHYCWFGGNKLSYRMEQCIASWKRYCPDYEIIKWDENNYDVGKYRYTEQAYRHKKWAYVSDVARLDILYNYGGIYMDTDVELIRGLDDLLYQPGFCGVEKWRVINTGGCCGAVRGNYVINKMLEVRRQSVFELPDATLNLESSGSYDSLPLIKLGFIPDNTMQVVRDMTVYPSDFFHPYDYMSKELHITENTYGIHHFAESWI